MKDSFKCTKIYCYSEMWPKLLKEIYFSHNDHKRRCVKLEMMVGCPVAYDARGTKFTSHQNKLVNDPQCRLGRRNFVTMRIQIYVERSKLVKQIHIARIMIPWHILHNYFKHITNIQSLPNAKENRKFAAVLCGVRNAIFYKNAVYVTLLKWIYF